MSLAVGGVQSTRNYWWLTLIRSLVVILFGIAALLWPGPTLVFFIYLFGVFAIVEGIIAIATAIQERPIYKNWWVLLLAGVAGIIVGILVFSWPGITSLILFYMVAAWAFVMGIMEIASAFSRFTIPGLDWPLILSGVVLVVLGLIMAAHPVASILSIIWVLGLAAIIYGVLLFVRSFQFKSLQDRGIATQGVRSSSGGHDYPEQGAGSSFGEYGRPEEGARSSFQTYDDYPAQSTPTTMPPGRNPTVQGAPPTTMPPGRNPSVQRDLSTGGAAPMRDTTPPGGTASSKGTMPTQDNIPPRNRPPAKGNVPPRDNIPPESTRQRDASAKDKPSWLEEENS